MGAVEQPCSSSGTVIESSAKRKTDAVRLLRSNFKLLCGNHREISAACVIDAQRWRMGCSSDAEIIAGTSAVLRTGGKVDTPSLAGSCGGQKWFRAETLSGAENPAQQHEFMRGLSMGR